MEKLYIITIAFGLFVFGVTYLLKFINIKEDKEENLPNRKKEKLMTKAEHEFFKVLQQVVQEKYYIVPQVQLSNLVQVEKQRSREYAFRNKIDRKSVDFVLFNKEYFTPYLVIELDDSSHSREDRKMRDGFVDSVLNKAGIRIMHLETAYNYDLNKVSAILHT
jgi:very-short-patch-repair endonuclease